MTNINDLVPDDTCSDAAWMLQWFTFADQATSTVAGSALNRLAHAWLSLRWPAAPLIWHQIWFVASVIVLVIAGLLALYAWRMLQLQAQMRALSAQVAQRNDELREANSRLEQEIVQRMRAEEALAQQTEEELHVSEARFRAMFDHAAVGMALLTLERRVVQANQAAARITGYALDTLNAMRPADLVLPEDRAIGQAEMRELIDGGRDACQIERRYVRPDDSVFWARVTFSAVPGPDGRPSYLMGMIEDIDEQRAARRKLEAQERKYRQHLEEHVQARTSELSQANQQLQLEMEQRQRAEAALAQKAADEAVAAERTRLAHDLHDAVTQTLFSASLIAEVLPDLWQIDAAEARASTDELRQLTRGALAEMRTLLLELRPAALTRARFGDLLKQLVEALVGRTRLPVALCVVGERDLPPEVQVAFYRIAQESLNNVIKHARARQVAVRLALTPAGVYLEVSDGGIGFDLAAAKLTSLGLRIMRERAETIGGELNMESNPGRGTRVSVLWTDMERGD